MKGERVDGSIGPALHGCTSVLGLGYAAREHHGPADGGQRRNENTGHGILIGRGQRRYLHGILDGSGNSPAGSLLSNLPAWASGK